MFTVNLISPTSVVTFQTKTNVFPKLILEQNLNCDISVDCSYDNNSIRVVSRVIKKMDEILYFYKNRSCAPESNLKLELKSTNDVTSLFASLQLLIKFGYRIKFAQTQKVKYPNSSYLEKNYCGDYNWSFLPRMCIEIRLPKGYINLNLMTNVYKRLYIIPIIPKDRGLVRDLDEVLDSVRNSNFEMESLKLQREIISYIQTLTKDGKEILEKFKDVLANCDKAIKVEDIDLEFHPYGFHNHHYSNTL